MLKTLLFFLVVRSATGNDGFTVSNPHSSVLCEIYMPYFNEILLNMCNFKYFLRYVDDTLRPLHKIL